MLVKLIDTCKSMQREHGRPCFGIYVFIMSITTMVFQECDTPVIAYINGQRYRGSSTSRIDLIKKLRTGSSINMFTALQIKYRIDVRRCITRIANTTTKN